MRKIFVKLFFLLFIVVLQACGNMSNGMPNRESSMILGGPQPPPPGYKDFCRRHKNECQERDPSAIVLTEETWNLLEEVQWEVNHYVDYMPDEVTGKTEWWTYPDNNEWNGDCEDFALEKRQWLVGAGLPRSALVIATATKNGIGHAVLVAITDRGDFILDNAKKYVMPWESLNYQWIAREGSNPKKWRHITGKGRIR